MRDGLRGDGGSEAPDHLHPLADILHAYQELFGSFMVAAHARSPPAEHLPAKQGGGGAPPSAEHLPAEQGGGGAPPSAKPGGGGAPSASRGKYTRTFAMPLPQATPRRPVFLAERNKKGCAVVTNLGNAVQVYELRHTRLWGYVVVG